jgi:predicted RNase H-like HicB family nuclease
MFYAAYVHIDPDGSASGSFPDVPGCFFAGDTFEETMADAKSALEAHFELIVDSGQDIPESTGVMGTAMNALSQGKETGGIWAVVDIDTTKFMGKAERINITLPHLLITKIDRMVSKNAKYGSRSHFLAEAAIKVMHQETN